MFLSRGKTSRSLITAVCDGNIAAVRKLKENGVELALTDRNGYTAVHHAAFVGSEAAVRILLEGSCSQAKDLIARETWMKETPLLLACMARRTNERVVHMLLSHGADPNAATLTNTTPLHYLCSKRGSPSNLRVVRMLVDMGARVNVIEDLRGATPIELALARSKDPALVRYLLRFANVDCTHDRQFSGALHHAFISMPEFVPDILARMAEPPVWSNLTTAFVVGTTDHICLLLQKGCKPDLVFASYNKAYESLDTFSVLLDSTKDEFINCELANLVIRTAPEPKRLFIEALVQNVSKRGIKIYMDCAACLRSETSPGYKYFPPIQMRSEFSPATLMSLCRPVVRLANESVQGNQWAAYCWLTNAQLPPQIKRFLLYEID